MSEQIYDQLKSIKFKSIEEFMELVYNKFRGKIHIREVEKENGEVVGIRFGMISNEHEYYINAHLGNTNSNKKSYLCCILGARVTRPFEMRTGGADLPSGKLNMATWFSIVQAIAHIELCELIHSANQVEGTSIGEKIQNFKYNNNDIISSYKNHYSITYVDSNEVSESTKVTLNDEEES